MTIIESTNIISALGFTSGENYINVVHGRHGLKLHKKRFNLQEPFMASEIDDVRLDDAFNETLAKHHPIERPMVYSKLEKAAIVSVADAVNGARINPADERTLFLLSTTKGNVFLLDKKETDGYEREQAYLWRSAEIVAHFFGNKNKPIVISNACISGACAIIAAQRELRSGRYGHVIVVGADILSKFIISGFQSFKALSTEICRPFDEARTGLNIGEAAATMIVSERPPQNGDIIFETGAIRNDANHISGPSRTGEGSFLALQNTLQGITPAELAFINAHGTATPYNDEMESIAITRAGLQNVPINSLKGYFGHTLGAAGVLESIISTYALKNGNILKTNGYDSLGVTSPIDIVSEIRRTGKHRFVKMLSGFGGCNAALLFSWIKASTK